MNQQLTTYNLQQKRKSLHLEGLRGWLLVVGCWLSSFTFAHAQATFDILEKPTGTLTFATLANKIRVIANAIIPFLISVAVVAIIWGIFRYVVSGASEESLQSARKFIIYGILGLFLILSFWGLVIIIATSLGIKP